MYALKFEVPNGEAAITYLCVIRNLISIFFTRLLFCTVIYVLFKLLRRKMISFQALICPIPRSSFISKSIDPDTAQCSDCNYTSKVC